MPSYSKIIAVICAIHLFLFCKDNHSDNWSTLFFIIFFWASVSGIIRVFLSKCISNVIGIGLLWILFYGMQIFLSFVEYSIKEGIGLLIVPIAIGLSLFWIVLTFFGYSNIYQDDFSFSKELNKFFTKNHSKK